MVDVPIEQTLRAARALRLAGRWEVATELLSAARASEVSERAQVAVAAADTAVDRAFWLGGDVPGGVLDEADAAIETVVDEALRWDLDLIRLRRAYQPALRTVMSGGQVEPAEAERLDAWAERLRAAAPDLGRAGWAAFWGGVIADNLRRAPEVAAERYTTAQKGAVETDDDLLASYALRHLGDHARDRGDQAIAREMWVDSTRLREKVGFVPGTLAQRILLVELLLDDGDQAGAVALATDVKRAAEAIGVTGLANAASGLIARAAGESQA